MPLAPGTRLGPYQITAPLGAGGMGEVYLARDTRLDRDVAIKVLPAAVSRDPDRLARFEREARVLASLNHPNIATVYGLEESPEGKALAMELVDGTTLTSPLPLPEALRLAGQIAEALEAAHKRGIVHRDLKPANIMVTTAGIKLLDFGLAKIDAGSGTDETATQTQAGVVLGTAAYMSPEQAQGRPIDARSDIFSFGAVLYEMVTGSRAFPGDSMAATLAAILRDDPAPPDIPAELQSVVARCLRKNPADRFQSAADLRAALDVAARSRTARGPSLAVLPFANLSADKENEYFSDGLAEEVLNALTQIPGLRVIARASAFAFRGRENAIAEIGEKLQVTSVLHGSVRRAGNRIRVSAQLINVADESQIWSERYDREMRDVFDIQDEIAQAIVAQLKVKLGGRSSGPLVKRYTENLEAHSLYLKGSFHLRRLTNEEMKRGREYLEQAVALDPLYAPAWVHLADYHIATAHRGAVVPLSQWPHARVAAAKAQEADPNFADAYAALGFVQAVSEFRWEEGMRGLDTALRMNPACSFAHFWRAHLLASLGRIGEALQVAHRAVELDPLQVLFRAYSALYCLMMGQTEHAREHSLQALDVNPNYPFALLTLGETHSLMGRHEEAIRCLEATRPVLPPSYFYVGFLSLAYIRAGRRDDAERLRASLEDRRGSEYISPATLAFIAVSLGDVESGFRFAAEAVVERDPNLNFFIRSPYFQPLHSDPRYPTLLGSMNLQP